MKNLLLASVISFFTFQIQSQNVYWQQKAAYTMEIDMDVEKNQFTGSQKLVYYNNSPDTLHRVFYHLYFNAFQPGSMMDVRSREIDDPDPRVGDRIFKLKEEEQGYQKIKLLKQDGKELKYEVSGTILEVLLNQAIYPNTSTVFEMDFEAQVPLQVRRSGRDNKEGVRFSMTQWYPKMAEYDLHGWNANPYVGREFHGVWGSFDVKINIDAAYVLGATGDLQNPQAIGHGYGEEVIQAEKGGKLQWHFKADPVHDFAWVADPEFTHKKMQMNNGTMLHFLYKESEETQNWDSLPKYAVQIFEIMNENFGEYPYKQYTVAQGGDGGMEYPMITLITGNRSKGSLIGVTAHEAVHSWYQHILATNEALYPWMDEGFTSYADNFVLEKVLNNFTPFVRSYSSYYSLVKSGKQEALSTHADHYDSNRSYGVASYSMGLIFLHQLSYIVGQENFMKSMKRYYTDWSFKHPTPNDFIRVVEKTCNMELSWYLEHWIHSTRTIDYGIKEVKVVKGKTTVVLENYSNFPMPIDLKITFKDGKEKWINIPLRIMRGEKAAETNMSDYEVREDWPWTFPKYELQIDSKLENIESIEIDPSGRMADVNRSNNVYPSDRGNSFIVE
tara:strand:- start:9062 stop:10903 length:1842 start_codon:yes stop_codon:yes gene_type:complete